jgi:apolipoprotein N-acyltransferase
MTILRRLRLLLAVVAGVALAYASPPHDVVFLAWISIAALVLLSLETPWWMAFGCGLAHGAGFFTFGLSWVYTLMRVHGRLGVLAAAGVLALLVFVMSLLTAAFALGVNLVGRACPTRACLAAPFLWVVVEFGRAHLPMIASPWNLLGGALGDERALLQIASVTGIYGLSFVVAAANALLAWLAWNFRRLRWRAVGVLVAVALVFVGVARVGRQFVPVPEGRYVAHLLQTNIPQTSSYPADWMERQAADLDEMERLSIAAAQSKPGVVVWPEVPAPFYLLDPKFASRAQRIAREGKSYFLLGVVDWKPHAEPATGGMRLEPYNSAVLLDPAGQRVFSYDKIHLVAFGEYVPLRKWLTFAEKLTAEVGEYRAGTVYAVGELPVPGVAPARRSGKFAVLICYEAAFPDEVRRFVSGGAELLVNLSNDGWFGHSGAAEQHLAMARVRAVENRRWLLRATNTGHTVVVDPYGRYAARLAPDRREVLDAGFDFRSDRTVYARFGDWFAWLCVLAGIAFLVMAARRGKEVGT